MSHTREHTDFAETHTRWHEQVEAQRSSAHGPLSVTAIHWLSDTEAELPELPGRWSATGDGSVTVHFADSDGVSRNGTVLTGATTLGPLLGIDAETLVWGDVRIQVAARGGRIAVRPQRPDSADRTNYSGTETFPASPDWVISGRFEPAPRVQLEVDSFVPGAQQHYDSPGRARFTIDGKELALTLFGEPDATELRALFADRTGEDLTYPAVRFVPVSRDGESVVIDFNRATNPPCAYSENATCPFPPPENRLDIRIEAGELKPDVTLTPAS